MKGIFSKLILLLGTMFFLSGCITLGDYKKFYRNEAPQKFQPTESVHIFNYGDADIDHIYNLYFRDYYRIGYSSFNSYLHDPLKAKPLAKKVGADVLIATHKFAGKKSYTYTTQTPIVTNVKDSDGKIIASSTTYQNETKTVNYDSYTQYVYFLKNIKGITPIWEETKADYICTNSEEFGGIWRDENYRIEIVKNGNNIMGFIVSSNYKQWLPGQIKFTFNTNSKSGIYILNDRSPWIANFKLNNFGFLDVEIPSVNEKFSFMKEK